MDTGALQSPTPAGRLALTAFFLRLGFTSFGGPLAHIAMLEEGVVRRRRWLRPDEFAEGLALCQMLPGPVSTQLGIYIGYLKGGAGGAALAGLAFILPAYLILVALSALYAQYGSMPQISSIFYGLVPAVVALVAAAGWRIARSTVRGWRGAIVAAAACAVRLALGVDEVLILLAAGLLGVRWAPSSPPGEPPAPRAPGKHSAPGAGAPGALAPGMILGVLGAASSGALAACGGPVLIRLAAICFKAGAFVFGGGYVIVPLLESQVVDACGWMSRTQFLDGVALGQITPGPILITAAFVGFRAAGVLGSSLATAAIFLPSFLWILACAPQIPRLRRWRRMQGFLAAVNPAVVGIIAASAGSLGKAAIVDPPGALIAVAVLGLATVARVDSALLAIGAGVAGLLLRG
jgi:chromate transporter